MSVLYCSERRRGDAWVRIFAAEAPELPFAQWPDHGDLSAVEYLVAWRLDPSLLARLPNLKVLFCIGAGVDQLDIASLPPSLPVVRMIDPGLVAGMIEYVSMAVLALHRRWPDYQAQQARREWRPLPWVDAPERRVGVMGLGVLGAAVLRHLASYGFALRGWSRTPHTLEGVHCYSGAEGRRAFLADTDILVCLLPLTAATRGVLDGSLFAQLPRGAALVNAARGAHLDAPALLAALDAGQLSHAVLDVTDPEPLPADSPLWSHPRVQLTPHVAAETRPATSARAVLDNIRRHLRGQPLHGLIDRSHGY
jgi:glyoxylate/hydroxypyruvate reductase